MPFSVARLATTRVLERVLSSGILEHPTDILYGKILYIIDIPLPATVAETVEKTIISTLQEEYFGVTKKNPVYQFEDCIKQVNAALAELAEDGKNEWVGHIHACIALLADDEIFVTHTGRVLGAVVRGNSFVPIFDTNTPERKILVHKTFANLASGQLSQNDTVILGNGEIGRHFSPQFLCQATGESPQSSVQAIFEAAKRLHLKNITTIIGKMVPDSDVLAEQGNNYTLVLEQSTGRAFQAPIRSVSAGGAAQTISTQIAPMWGKLKQYVLDGVKAGTQFIQAKSGTLVKNVKSEPKTSVTFEETTVDLPPVPVAPSSPLHQRTPGQKFADQLSRLSRQSAVLQKQVTKNMSRVAPKNLLIAAVVLVAIIGISVWTRARHNVTPAQNTAATTALNQAKSDIAQANILQNNPQQARTLLNTAAGLLQTVPSSLKTTSQYTAVNDSYYQALATINHATVISASDTEDVDKTTMGVFVLGQYLFTTRTHSNSIFRQTIGKKDAPQIAYNVPSNDAISYTYFIDATRQAIIVTSANKLYMADLNTNNQPVELIPPSGQTWPAVQSITSYQKNLYILEKNVGQIWKFTTTDGIHFLTKQPYLASSSLINPKTTALASDGYIYTLANDASMTKLLKGAPQSFGPIQLPDPTNGFVNPQNIFTEDSINNIYVQDQKQVIALDKDGHYVHQYLFKDGTITTSFISPKTQKAWLLVGSKVLGTDL